MLTSDSWVEMTPNLQSDHLCRDLSCGLRFTAWELGSKRVLPKRECLERKYSDLAQKFISCQQVTKTSLGDEE